MKVPAGSGKTRSEAPAQFPCLGFELAAKALPLVRKPITTKVDVLTYASSTIPTLAWLALIEQAHNRPRNIGVRHTGREHVALEDRGIEVAKLPIWICVECDDKVRQCV